MNKKPVTNKALVLVFLFFFVVGSLLSLTWKMYQDQNEGYEAPTFAAKSQVIVTVDPGLMIFAQEWSIPEVLFVSEENNPQIRPEAGVAKGAMAGAEATRHMDENNNIISCGIKINPGATSAMMTHEMGHCLGLSHEIHKGGTNMYRGAEFYQQGWSDTVTDWDRENLRNLYTK